MKLIFEESTEPLLQVDSLKTYYKTKTGNVKAVDSVSLFVDRAKILGVAGESGCGKSTLVTTIFRVLPRNAQIVEGEVKFKGQEILKMDLKTFRKNIVWRDIAYIPQASMDVLDPVYKIKDQMIETILAHEDVSKAEATERIYKALESVGVPPEKADMFPHELSGGQRQRVVIAMALLLNPSMVVSDEATTALDVITQAKVLKIMKDLQESRKFSMMFVTHDLALLANISDSILIMYAGKVVEFGDVEKLFRNPLHPYTKALVDAIPDLRLRKKKKLVSIPGYPPDLENPPKGCRFAPRCPIAMPICSQKEPPLTRIEGFHYVACHAVTKQ
ncbi:dipeptide/oligopeptide/nickel ABC transporter ATP-binding protein [Sulfolobus acidocaldarius]|uniref:Dipeptide/oligopeptide/nickel ABC transporter ATP-binding protein n=3 Tax=Sulfolobus acidocaldarius TaxID=2285 RepID=A0A0U3GKM4_9CREN|nr:ABC transporter [Sulfolobus acidocaldarius N8]AGE73950.1 ABC transporter [Sulfolobus acidocaldarius Ron12/I]ALU30111.1 dipeptide/oligopeptide/nickel ABC transporter ATP-binding protein [Sulfolobus acidocaldarius]ALU30805.1 dipeptide/oligopeptide/nickel ABC transporter ATP-binding protein [Sulfolobus acidocaldarius]WCM35578.1 ATP-binding cassette domain-containing protein [Sulfolobus acidocaldarius DSM 639]